MKLSQTRESSKKVVVKTESSSLQGGYRSGRSGHFNRYRRVLLPRTPRRCEQTGKLETETVFVTARTPTIQSNKAQGIFCVAVT